MKSQNKSNSQLKSLINSSIYMKASMRKSTILQSDKINERREINLGDLNYSEEININNLPILESANEITPKMETSGGKLRFKKDVKLLTMAQTVIENYSPQRRSTYDIPGRARNISGNIY